MHLKDILDACIRHRDHCNGWKVAAMVLLGTAIGANHGLSYLFLYSILSKAHAGNVTNTQLSFSWGLYGTLARAGECRSTTSTCLNLLDLDILQKIENQDNSW